MLSVCASNSSCSRPAVIDAKDYDAFWLWAGVEPQPVLERARRIYLLDAEVRPGATFLVSQRPSVPHVKKAEVWMVIRVETLQWTPATHAQVLNDLARWKKAGNHMAGLQVDFDARTRFLEDYSVFLQSLRKDLPTEYKLSITGLLDWSSNGDPQALDQLAGIVDEVVLQTYQGRHIIPGYENYLARLNRLKIPFRIGLLEGGQWRQPSGMTSNPYFRGFVVFLQNSVLSR